jgi:predicted O-methyltransferase YrrM
LAKTEDVQGDVVEIGCAKGGTTVRIAKFLRETESSSRVIGIDTFEGFTESQFEHDAALGLGRHKRSSFSINDIAYARSYAAREGFPETEFVKSDVFELNLSDLTGKIRVALADVDLELPTKASLEKIYPLLEPGGFIVVDDFVNKGYGAGVKRAVEAFCSELVIDYEERYGAAVISKPRI